VLGAKVDSRRQVEQELISNGPDDSPWGAPPEMAWDGRSSRCKEAAAVRRARA